MNIESIQRKIVDLNNQNLSIEQKEFRSQILNVCIDYITYNENYEKMLNQFIKKGMDLKNITDGIFRIEKSLYLNKVSLKGYILNSDACKELKNQNIVNYSIDELKQYIEQYKNIKGDISNIEKALNLYIELLSMEQFIEKSLEQIANKINNILKDNLLINKNGDSLLIRDELSSNNLIVNQKINNLLNNNMIDNEIKEYLTIIINEYFNYYISGKNIPTPEPII